MRPISGWSRLSVTNPNKRVLWNFYDSVGKTAYHQPVTFLSKIPCCLRQWGCYRLSSTFC
jgi:hypothetical protein